MDVINEQRPYPFSYLSKPITNSKQYEWMGYISFPYDVIYLSSSSLEIDCSSSFLYSQSVFYSWTQVNSNLCLYNNSYQNLFVALRQVSASQELTIYFDEDRRRSLCGVCNCDLACEQMVGIVVGVCGTLFVLLCFFLCIKYRVFRILFYNKKVTIGVKNS